MVDEPMTVEVGLQYTVVLEVFGVTVSERVPTDGGLRLFPE
jgi:hypothetical protein